MEPTFRTATGPRRCATRSCARRTARRARGCGTGAEAHGVAHTSLARARLIGVTEGPGRRPPHCVVVRAHDARVLPQSRVRRARAAPLVGSASWRRPRCDRPPMRIATACGGFSSTTGGALSSHAGPRLHVLDASLAVLVSAGRERLHEAGDRAFAGPPVTAAASLLAPVRGAGGVGERRHGPPVGDRARGGIRARDPPGRRMVLPAPLMKRTFEEIVNALFCEPSYPAGAVLLTGMGVVSPDEATRRDGDAVRIAIEGVGALVRAITVQRAVRASGSARPVASASRSARTPGPGAQRYDRAVSLSIERPSKIVCVGLNYRDHAEETGAPLP